MTARNGSTSRVAAAFAAAALMVAAMSSILQLSATAAPVPTDLTTAARAGSSWLSGQSTAGVLSNFGQPDWGLTSDAVLAHAAAGRGPTAGEAGADQIEANVDDYVSPDGGTQRLAGPLAKVLVVAAVSGRNPASFGGWNLRPELLALMHATPADPYLGRFSSAGGADASNGFSQTLAIIGLARTGTVPADAVTFLLHQQCPDGGFRLFYTVGPTCTANVQSDVDTTGLAIQALQAAASVGIGGTDAALTAALDWLAGRQLPDGSFAGSGPTGTPNANSTGLAAQGLRSGGRVAAADLAATWLRSMQLDCASPVPAADRGAVAYDATSLADTIAGSAMSSMYRDQFRRATSQAVLGLATTSMLTLSTATVGDGPATFDCSVTTTTTVAGATSTTTTTTVAGGSSTTSTTIAATSTTTTTIPTTTSTTVALTTTTIGARVSDEAAVAVNPSPAANGVEVAGTSIRSSAGSGSGTGSNLAVTGTNPLSYVAAALLALSLGVAMLGARRGRD